MSQKSVPVPQRVPWGMGHRLLWDISRNGISGYSTQGLDGLDRSSIRPLIQCLAEMWAVCSPVPGDGHGSHGLFQALPTLYVQQHILLVTLNGSSFSQVVPL